MLVSSRLRLFTEGFGEQRWRNKADAGMAPLSVVENLNVFLNRGLCLSTGGIAAMMDKLILQRAPEAFYRLTGGCGKASTGLLAPFVELGADSHAGLSEWYSAPLPRSSLTPLCCWPHTSTMYCTFGIARPFIGCINLGVRWYLPLPMRWTKYTRSSVMGKGERT